jgi:hypothetical protein
MNGVQVENENPVAASAADAVPGRVRADMVGALGLMRSAWAPSYYSDAGPAASQAAR